MKTQPQPPPPSSHLDKYIKQAFYNTGAMIFVGICCGAAVLVFFILEAFLRPLLWAVLCGTFLHPFKRSLAKLGRSWLGGLRSSGTPVLVGTLLVPLWCVNYGVETMSRLVQEQQKVLLAIGAGVPLGYVLVLVWSIAGTKEALWETWGALDAALNQFHAVWVCIVVCGYMLAVCLKWSPQTKDPLSHLALPVWAVLLFYIVSLSGSWKVPLFVLVLLLLLLGFLEQQPLPGGALVGQIWSSAENTVYTTFSYLGFNSRPDSVTNNPQSIGPDPVSQRSQISPQDSDPSPSGSPRASDTYFLFLAWAIVLVQVWLNLWLLKLLPIPVIVWLLKKLAVRSGFQSFVQQTLSSWGAVLGNFAHERESALFPGPIKGLARFLLSIDTKMIGILERSVDKIISVFIIFALIVGTLLMGLLLTAMVHHESTQIIEVTGNLINRTLSNHPEWANWLPEARVIEKAMNSAVTNVYQHGREWITLRLQKMLGDKVSNSAIIQEHILDLWDQLYHTWFDKKSTTSRKQTYRTSTKKPSGWLKDIMFWKEIVSFLQENIDTLLSILESVWAVMSRNVGLLISSANALLTILIHGGTALLNFSLGVVIFLTTLFYLLSSSGEYYKPVNWIISLIPMSQPATSSNIIGQSVEEAIRGVFDASLKMAAFYGLYTWLTHTVFGINIIFVPSALAAALGAVPFLGTYWAAVPALCDLWLVQGDSVKPVLLLLFHLLPTYFVDTAIYSDISGAGHPYLTGLAVAGGAYYLGLEGAIIGPTLLCILLMAANIYSAMLLTPGSAKSSQGSTSSASLSLSSGRMKKTQ